MKQHLATPISHWSTQAVPLQQRLDYWVGAISEGFLAMAASARNVDFHGELHSAQMGLVGVNHVQADAQKVWRTHRDIALGGERFCYLLGNLNAPWFVAQDGMEAQLDAGDFVLVDARRPYHFDFSQGVQAVSLELPIEWLSRWVAEPETHVARPFRHGHAGWAGALASFALPWRPQLVEAPPLPSELLVDQLGALMALACVPDVAARQASSLPLNQRIVDHLRQRLAEPGLTATHVANALNVSVRSVHRAMAATQQTFAQVLLAERMKLARQMLRNPRLQRVSIAEIGRRLGLLDPSHFARLCRRYWGQTPAQLRQH